MAVILRTAATITGAAYSSPGISQLWWAPQTAGGSTADATDCLARFRAAWNSFVAFFTNTATITFDPVCIAIEATTGALTGSFVGTQPANVVGGVSVDALPKQTQGLIRFGTNTVVNGRRLRGRLFLPNPAEADNTAAGAPSSTYQSTANSAFGSILSGGATTSAPVIWHRPVNGAGGQSALITSVGCAPSWSVLRSRRG